MKSKNEKEAIFSTGKLQRELDYRFRLEDLITRISTYFINLPSRDIDNGINQALEAIGEFTQVDRSYVFRYSADGKTMDNSHEWCAEGIEPQKDNINFLPVQALPWWTREIRKGQAIHIPRVDDLPDDAVTEKMVFKEQEIRSLICVPIIYQNHLEGFLGFDSVRCEKVWSQETINLLKIVGEIVVNALKRKENEQELLAKQKRYDVAAFAGQLGVWEWSLQTKEMFVDQNLKALLGYEDHEIENDVRVWEKMIYHDDLMPLQKEIALHLKGEKAQYEKQFRIFHKNGDILWLLIRGVVVRNKDGNPKKVVGVTINITEQKKLEENLRNAELSYRMVADFTYDWELWINPDLTFRYSSPACEKITGYKAAEFIKNPKMLEKIILPKDRKIWLKHKSCVKNGHTSKLIQFRIQHKDGSVRWVEHACRLVMDEEKGFLGARASNRDITERKNFEESLAISERSYRLTIDSLLDAIHVVDKDLRIVLINKSLIDWCKNFGLIKKVLGRSVLEVFPFLPKKIVQEYKKVFKTGKELITEEASCIKGQTIITETRKIPLVEDKRVSKIITIIRDITERKTIERAIVESEEKYRTLIEAAEDAIILVEAKEGYIIDANIKAGELIGVDVDKLKGTHFSELHPKGEVQFYRDIFYEFVRRPNKKNIEAYIESRDGRKIPVQISASIFDLRGEKVVLGIFRDITDLKALEVALRKDRAGLAKVVDEQGLIIDQTRKELADAKRLSDIGVLAATVAHELRNPLGVIRTALYNIRRKKTDDALDKHINNIEKKIKESDQIIKNLLGYARIKLPHFEKVSILEILSESLSQTKNKYKDHRVKVSKEFVYKRDIFIEADRLHMAELFINILDNAYQSFNNKKGTLSIDIKRLLKANQILLRFEDNGCGINKNDLPQVFDPFFTRKSKGTGLGLTLCNQLVNVHNGKMELFSEKGIGTTVEVRLPLKQD